MNTQRRCCISIKLESAATPKCLGYNLVTNERERGAIYTIYKDIVENRGKKQEKKELSRCQK